MTCTYTGPAPTAGQVLPVITISATATVPPPFPPYTNTASVSITSSSGYVDTVPGNNSSTVTVSKPTPCPQPPPIDVAIDKEEDFSGSLGHPVINIYIINVGPPITFGPGQLTVTESIPAGYTVTSVNAPNWTCSPTSLVGAGTVTCTYNLAGSLAPSVGLSDSITIDGMLTGPGPLQNCATVTVGASVGVDTNLANNTVCRPIGVPVRTCDPATTITRGAECPCRYPNMVRTSKRACMCLSGASFVAGRGCVPRLECPPPLVPGPVPGVCVCPAGTTLVGRECVRPTVCPPPMVPGPVAGQCIDVRPTCTPPKVMRRGQCVDVRPTCDPPKVMRRGQCVDVRPTCEPPKVMRRGQCVDVRGRPCAIRRRNSIAAMCANVRGIWRREERCIPSGAGRPTITPGDIIRNIPGRGRDTPRDPRGGSQGPTESPGRR